LEALILQLPQIACYYYVTSFQQFNGFWKHLTIQVSELESGAGGPDLAGVVAVVAMAMKSTHVSWTI